jgi:hypothetical protein
LCRFAIIIIGATLLSGCKQSPGNVRADAAEPDLIIEYIQLQRRNWENNGTDRTISKDGEYVVVGVALGERKEILRKTLTQSELNDLRKQILDADIRSFKDAYDEPSPDTWNWWGIALTVTTNQWTKTIRFHSKDETVPQVLKDIVQRVLVQTK